MLERAWSLRTEIGGRAGATGCRQPPSLGRPRPRPNALAASERVPPPSKHSGAGGGRRRRACAGRAPKPAARLGRLISARWRPAPSLIASSARSIDRAQSSPPPRSAERPSAQLPTPGPCDRKGLAGWVGALGEKGKLIGEKAGRASTGRTRKGRTGKNNRHKWV